MSKVTNSQLHVPANRILYGLNDHHPMIAATYRHLRTNGIDVRSARLSNVALRRKVPVSGTITHLHWIDHLFTIPSIAIFTMRSIQLFAYLGAIRLRGGKVLWTHHNEVSHDGIHPRAERLVRSIVGFLVNQYHYPNPEMRLKSTKGFAAPLWSGLDRQELLSVECARKRLGLPNSAVVLACVGSLRQSKGILEFVEQFRECESEELVLIIAGSPTTNSYGDELVAIADNISPRCVLKLEYLEENDLYLYIAAADYVVLPYRTATNSGVATLALDAGKHVLSTSLPAFKGLASTHPSLWTTLPEKESEWPSLLDSLRRAEQFEDTCSAGDELEKVARWTIGLSALFDAKDFDEKAG